MRLPRQLHGPRAASSSRHASPRGAAQPQHQGPSLGSNTTSGTASPDRTHSAGASEEAKRFTSQSGKGTDVPADPLVPDLTSAPESIVAPVAHAGLGSVSSPATTPGNTRADGLAAPALGKAGNNASDPNRAATLEKPQAGYRTGGKAQVQLDAAARESVFRQIAMRLSPTGAGEIRMLLDPADLGELDIKIRIDGNVMNLTIVTERPELAQELSQDIASLRDSLRAQGLDVGQTDIESRDNAPDGRSPEGWELQEELDAHVAARAASGSDPVGAPLPAPERSHQYLVTADRLDFWA